MERIWTILLFWIALCLVSCSNRHSIQGNWYTFLFDTSGYVEVNFDGNVCRDYNDLHNNIIEQTFQIKNDTIFFYFKGELRGHYCPHISWLSKDSFRLEYVDDIQVYHRIPEYEYTLDKIESNKWWDYFKMSYQLRKFKYSNGRADMIFVED